MPSPPHPQNSFIPSQQPPAFLSTNYRNSWVSQQKHDAGADT
jgi:hypothetical protein